MTACRLTSRASRFQRGFTLLEVMLVLLLMGLIVGTVTFTSLGKNREEALHDQAQRFAVVMNMVSDHAVLNQVELGLRVEEGRYYFLMLDEQQKWQPVEEDKLLKEHKLPEDFSLELELEDLPWQEEDSLFEQELFDEQLSVSEEGVEIGEEEEKIPPPQILLLSSGEITPFSLFFKYEPGFGNDEPVYFRVDAQDMPPLSLSDAMDRL
ncbi:type II secretion system minor pseudopilin GspH [Bowmanella dokdonensis]|uniref:Type II secretion system protein H n=1 Tax=Bowmanella dokdonensis TaxID=751969 RepID=A0A939IP65_9ALTE|nr:type II secretion system minor pseudopilin GspH [Bowmanella dokdonensis]MBN7823649.1 type II secretion system minor pseudopilin GspH [Bowmanella dokdonensis]